MCNHRGADRCTAIGESHGTIRRSSRYLPDGLVYGRIWYRLRVRLVSSAQRTSRVDRETSQTDKSLNDKVGLGLTTASEASFDTFFIGENELALERVRQGERVWLYGEAATGKTHILHSLVRETVDARYTTERPPNLDEDVRSPLLLIDDIDRLCGDEENEYALFAAYEATDFTKTRWVVSAQSAPNEVSFLYRDLASRMSLFERVELQPVPESARGNLLKFWANDRAFGISDEVIQFLLDRTPRTQESLWDTLKKLDRASLLENRTLTIPFVREVMGFDRS